MSGFPLQESIPKLFYEGRTTMTTHCAPACSQQVLPVKPQGVWARDVGHVTSEIWSFGGGVFRALQPNALAYDL